VWPLDDVLETLVVIFHEAEVFYVHLYTFAVKHPHDHGLAVGRRDNAYAHVKVFALNDHFDTTVLRAPLLRDIDASHNLDTRDQRSEQPPRRAVALDKDPV